MSARFDISNPVSKPWGFEFEYFDNGNLSIWVLLLGLPHKSGYLEQLSVTSMHLHEKKDAIAFCVRGEVEIRTESGATKLEQGQHIFIESGTCHQISTRFPNSILIEIERPSNRSDIKRLRDMYGREGEGYVWNTSAYLDAEAYGFTKEDNKLRYNNEVIIQRFLGDCSKIDIKRRCFILPDNHLGLQIYEASESVMINAASEDQKRGGFILYSASQV